MDKVLLDYQAFASQGISNEKKYPDILHFALGLAGETGEVCDDIKKREYHGRDIPIEHTIEELGDVMWYVANICNSLGITIEEVLEKNVVKLKERYKGRY